MGRGSPGTNGGRPWRDENGGLRGEEEQRRVGSGEGGTHEKIPMVQVDLDQAHGIWRQTVGQARQGMAKKLPHHGGEWDWGRDLRLALPGSDRDGSVT